MLVPGPSRPAMPCSSTRRRPCRCRVSRTSPSNRSCPSTRISSKTTVGICCFYGFQMFATIQVVSVFLIVVSIGLFLFFCVLFVQWSLFPSGLQGKRSESMRFLSSFHWEELKGKFCAQCFSA